MTQLYIDDQIPFHRKTLKAGNAAFGAWVRMAAYCSQNLTGRAGKHWEGTLVLTAAELGDKPAQVIRQRLLCLYDGTDWSEIAGPPPVPELGSRRGESQ